MGFLFKGVAQSAITTAGSMVINMMMLLAVFVGCAQLPAQVVGEVRGRVTDARTTRPIANGLVELAGRGELVRTAPDGGFVLRGLEPGTYAVTIRALGYAQLSREVKVENGRATQLDAALIERLVVLGDVQVHAARDTTALNTIVFERSAIEQSGRRDIGELLQTTPGVVITQSGGPGQPSQISMRGSSANQVLVLIDGVPLNSALSGGADLSRIALENVEKITVRTGAQSARYGPRAMAGVIEIDTRKPRHESSAMFKTGALGEHAASALLGNSTTGRDSNVGAFISGEYRTVAGNFTYTLPALRGGGHASRINSDATTKLVATGVSLDGTVASATLRANWQETERGLAGTIIQPSSTGRQGNSRLNIGGSAQGSLHRVAWTFATDVTHEEGTFIDHSPPFGQAFDDTISATGFNASSSAAVGTGQMQASGGAELRTLDVRSTMLSIGAPHWQQLIGAWGNARLSHDVAADVRVDAEVSGRVDRSSLSGESMFSPRGTMRISRAALSTSVSLGSGFAPPTLSDQFFHEGVQVRANPALRPERTRRDLEARATLRELNLSMLAVSGEVAAYRSNVDGMILWFPDFRFIWSPMNYDVKRSGWELAGKIAVPTVHAEVAGTLNRNDVVYTGSILHGQVVYRPRNSANLTAAFAPRDFRVEIANRYVGSRRTVAGSALNSLAPYWMSDVRASRTFATSHWTFNPAASVENAFNHAAAMLVDYPFPPRTWSISLRVRRSTSQSP